MSDMKFQVVLDPDLEQILPRYFEIRLDELRQMEQAASTGDTETVRLLGHRLKGTGSSYGFSRLTELGAAIEVAGKGGQLDSAEPLIAEVRKYLENVEIIYGEQG